MCGISGFYDKKRRLTKDHVVKMNEALIHRGPDASGVYQEGLVGLGHRRLSIIDLSDAANQPFHSSCGRYVMVYNGEIYNYQELARHIKIPLKTSSDTEVILELFVQEGEHFISMLNGMFAFSIYDTQTQELFLYRDRMGVKPLVYYWDGEIIAFASEIKALLALPPSIINKEVNHEAIAYFLHLNFIPDPLSAFKNIYKLEAGTSIKFDGYELIKKRYWSVGNAITSNTFTDEKSVLNTVHELLESSISYRMISDVPVGTFLSGGVDSSVVTAIMQSISSQPVNTFSIGFKESKFNESIYAEKVSKLLGTNHHAFILSEQDALDKIDVLFNSYDEPFADISAIPTLLVSEMARKQNVVVCLTGDGGDELFHGYNRYLWADRLQNPFLNLVRKPAASVFSLMSERYKQAGRMLSYDDKETLSNHIHSQDAYAFLAREVKDMTIVPALDFNKVNVFSTIRVLNNIEQQALFDLSFYLRDDLLYKIDTASMRYSLELREPLLDYRLVEFALNIDPSLKYKNGDHKYILKQVLYKYLPEELFKRPKWGFTAPLKGWLSKDLHYLIADYLSKHEIEKAGLVKYNQVRIILLKYESGDETYYQKIWSLIALHKWHRRFF